ncbi:hypothetical protein VPHD148_0224 [Vibrio phage D148]
MVRDEFPRGLPDGHTVVFHEEVDRKECLIVECFGNNVDLYMRSRTGPWTHVQGFHRGRGIATIDKASNFKAPIPIMGVFLRACTEIL